MLKQLIQRIRQFREGTEGVVAVEGVVILPVLFWAYCSMFTFFDAYRQTSLNIKAAYTVGDMLSRETDFINDAYLDGAIDLFEFLTRSYYPSKLRVTVVRWDDVNKVYKRDWSKTRGAIPELSNNQVRDMAAKLPVMPHNERVIVVETWSKYTPPFNIGLQEQDLYNFVFTRPRFAPQLLFQI